MGGIVIGILILVIGVVGAFIKYSLGREILICASCGNKFTRDAFSKSGGRCPRCGSDLVKKTGQYVN